MFYKALGFAVWKLGMRYVRKNYGRKLRIAGLLAVALVLAGIVVARSQPA
jgi:hypothetical protein